MKNIILASCLFAATALTTSCSDFLDVKPTHAADADASIKTAADAQVIMRGLMSKLTSSNYYGRNFPLYADVKGGDLTIFSQGRGFDYVYVFNHSTTSNNYSGIWDQGYHCLVQINNLLKQIDIIKASGSTENFNDYIGQALTIRAMIHFDLVRLYGKPYNQDKASFGVPIALTPLEYNAQPTRSTVEEVYAQILKDLAEAAPLIAKAKNNGYINYYGNKALEARVNLYKEDYNAALTAAEEIINSNVYTLYSNANWTGSWAKQFDTESIFELAIFPSESDLGNSSLGAYYRRRAHGASAILGYFTASTNFLSLLNEDASDVRKNIMAYDETVGNNRFGAVYKYNGSTALSGDGKGNSTAVNIKVIRLSEVYLIAAEAALKKSSPDLTKAANYLQQIRKRAAALTPATASTVTLEMIANERSKELIGEGHRFFDMMRWNKSITFDDSFGAVSTIHREAIIDRTFFKTILPIPLSEINANPEIAKQQNPGYNN